jgi:hypothetical protein
MCGSREERSIVITLRVCDFKRDAPGLEITEFGQYRDLVGWAARSRDAGELLPLPKEFQRHSLHPFRK